MIMNLMSIVLSTFLLIVNIASLFKTEESRFFNFFGNFETIVCIGICLALIIIGLIMEYRKDKELYG